MEKLGLGRASLVKCEGGASASLSGYRGEFCKGVGEVAGDTALVSVWGYGTVHM